MPSPRPRKGSLQHLDLFLPQGAHPDGVAARGGYRRPWLRLEAVAQASPEAAIADLVERELLGAGEVLRERTAGGKGRPRVVRTWRVGSGELLAGASTNPHARNLFPSRSAISLLETLDWDVTTTLLQLEADDLAVLMAMIAPDALTVLRCALTVARRMLPVLHPEDRAFGTEMVRRVGDLLARPAKATLGRVLQQERSRRPLGPVGPRGTEADQALVVVQSDLPWLCRTVVVFLGDYRDEATRLNFSGLLQRLVWSALRALADYDRYTIEGSRLSAGRLLAATLFTVLPPDLVLQGIADFETLFSSKQT